MTEAELTKLIRNWKSYPVSLTVDLKTGKRTFYKDGKVWKP
jgi:hypothetical protein